MKNKKSEKKEEKKNLEQFLKNASKNILKNLTIKNYQITQNLNNFLKKIQILSKSSKISKIIQIKKKVIITIEIQNDKIFASDYYIIIVLSSSSEIQFFVSDYKISSFFINSEKNFLIAGLEIGLIAFFDLNYDFLYGNYKEWKNTEKINFFLKKNFLGIELKNAVFISNYIDEESICKILAIYSKNDQLIVFDENYCFKVFKIVKKDADFFEIKFLLNFQNSFSNNFYEFKIHSNDYNIIISQDKNISFLDFKNSENFFTNLKFDKSIKYVYKTISDILIIIFKTEEILITDIKNDFNFFLPFYLEKKIIKIIPFGFSKYDQNTQNYNKFEILNKFIIITKELHCFIYYFDENEDIFKIEKDFPMTEKIVKKIFFVNYDPIDIKFHIYFETEEKNEEIFVNIKKYKPKIKKLSILKKSNINMIEYFYQNSYSLFN